MSRHYTRPPQIAQFETYTLTTPPGARIDDPVSWFREVVETEIAPLLREYWFDQTKTAKDQERKLLEEF